tara:strand:+ start:1822 stop:3288 length:1467 start_codon:yes stop_codon:yes gene_type:complete
MAFFDRFKRAKKAARRRSYAAANTGRLFADFVSTTRSSDSETRPAIKILRNRSRDLARNDEYVRRYLGLLKTNVVGPTGVNLQAKARNIDGTLDAPGNKIVENAWAAWGKRGNCTADGRLSWVDSQRLFIEALARDGEVLLRFVSGFKNRDRFAIEFVEADLLDEDLNTKAANGNRIRMGVEVNDFGASVAYHLLREHPGDQEFATGYSRKYTRVPADEMLHLFLPERAHQTRGVPMVAAAMSSLKILHGYREAELVAARLNASKMGFITSPDGDGYTGDDLEDTHSPIMSAEPGSFEQLPTGMDIKLFDPTHPSTAFSDFNKAVLRGIASGLGVSYASLASDLESVNYSSIRQGSLEERDFYKTLQQFMIDHFVAPVFEAWLRASMTAGELPLPMTKYDKFSDSITYRPRGFSWVDPLKEITAQIKGVENGVLSLQDVASHYGRDIEEVFEAHERERELADRFGISLAFQPFGAKRPAEPQVTNVEE